MSCASDSTLPHVGSNGSPRPRTEMVASKNTKEGTSPTKVGTSTGIMRGIMYWTMMRMLLALYDLAASMYGASFTCRNMARYDLMLALNMLRATQMAVSSSKFR